MGHLHTGRSASKSPSRWLSSGAAHRGAAPPDPHAPRSPAPRQADPRAQESASQRLGRQPDAASEPNFPGSQRTRRNSQVGERASRQP